jgi:hypothetical protein
VSEVGGRLGCTRVIRGGPCGKPKLHDQHVSLDPAVRICPGYIKPARKVRREAMAAHSDKNQVYYDEERIPEVQAIQGAPCEARISDTLTLPAHYRCTGSAVDIHELVRRSAVPLPRQSEEGYPTLAVCRNCHNWISRHTAGARALGFELRLPDIAS